MKNYNDDLFKVGDEVQLVNDDLTTRPAVVKYVNEDDGLYEIEMDDGVLSTVEWDDLFPRDSDLEKEFRNLYLNHRDEIEEQLDIARKALREAVKLSEKYGLPFTAGVSFIRNAYCPDSFFKKFVNLEYSFVSDLTEVSSHYCEVLSHRCEDSGWLHSAIC